jgi:hypothetical protein
MENSTEQKQTYDHVKPRVEIFGEEVSSWRGHRNGRHSHGRGNFLGIILLLLGGLFLLNNFGFLSAEFWSIFWPVLLILIGIRFMLGNSLVARIILLVLILALFVLIVLLDRHVAAGFSFNPSALIP